MSLGTSKISIYMMGGDALPDASGFLVCGEVRTANFRPAGTFGGYVASFNDNWEVNWGLTTVNHAQHIDTVAQCKFGEPGFVYFVLQTANITGNTDVVQIFKYTNPGGLLI